MHKARDDTEHSAKKEETKKKKASAEKKEPKEGEKGDEALMDDLFASESDNELTPDAPINSNLQSPEPKLHRDFGRVLLQTLEDKAHDALSRNDQEEFEKYLARAIKLQKQLEGSFRLRFGAHCDVRLAFVIASESSSL